MTTPRDNAYPDPQYEARSQLDAQERLDAARSSKGVAGRNLVGKVIPPLRQDNIDVRIENGDGSTSVVRNCDIVDSPHPIGLGDTVLVWQTNTGANFAKGLIESHTLDANRSHPIAQNQFVARVYREPTPANPYVCHVVPALYPAVILPCAIPLHIAQSHTHGPNTTIPVTNVGVPGLTEFTPLSRGQLVAVARDTGLQTEYAGRIGDPLFYQPVHWITALFPPPNAFQSDTPHVGLRNDNTLTPFNITLTTGIRPDTDPSDITPAFAADTRSYTIGSTGEFKVLTITFANPTGFTAGLWDTRASGYVEPGEGLSDAQKAAASQERWGLHPDRQPTIFVLEMQALQSARHSFYRFVWPE